jgi:FlaG/FlaF family flagellin (archaellin)
MGVVMVVVVGVTVIVAVTVAVLVVGVSHRASSRMAESARIIAFSDDHEMFSG